VTHEHILPWVRLHALKDYYGMVAMLDAFPEVRITFNLVPSLLVQLEAFAAGRAHDRFLELSLKPAETLTNDDILFILANFFHAQRQRMIEELQALRTSVEAARKVIEGGKMKVTVGNVEELRNAMKSDKPADSTKGK